MNEAERRLLDVMRSSSYMAAFADPSRTILGIEPYVYAVDALAVNITQAAAQSFDLIMDNDSDFVATSLSGGARISVPAIVAPANGNRVVEFSPALLVQITNQADGKTYFNIPTPLPLIAGAGGFPFLLTSPRVVRPRSTLTVSAQGFQAGVTFADFFFAIGGAKIFYAGHSS